jgi:drug/metabolite transporter (DMT)-like permease
MGDAARTPTVLSNAAPGSSQTDHRRALLVLTVALVAVSGAAIFVRLADAPGLVVAAWRMLIAALILLPWTLQALRRTRLRREHRWPTLLAGSLLAIHFATWISSLSYTSVAASVALVSTTPMWVVLLAWIFLRRVPTLSVLFGVLLAVAGGAVIAFGDFSTVGTVGAERHALLGDALAVVGAIAMAGYLLLGRSVQRQGLPLPAFVGVAYSVAALLLLPLPALAGWAYLDYTPTTFLYLGLLAIVPQLIGHTGIQYAMAHLEPIRVSTAVLMEPIGAGLFAWLLFSEVPGGVTLLGGAMLLVGVFITVRTGELGR